MSNRDYVFNILRSRAFIDHSIEQWNLRNNSNDIAPIFKKSDWMNEIKKLLSGFITPN